MFVFCRYLLNDACVLSSRPLVSGGALRFEGQVCIYAVVTDASSDPSYLCS